MRQRLSLVACCAVALALACDGTEGEPDAGDGEERGSVGGSVSFVGDAPSAGRVLVILHEPSPASGPPAGLSDDLGLVGDGGSVDYLLEGLPFGTYRTIAAYWEDPDDADMETRYHDLTSEDPGAVEPVVLSAEQSAVHRDLVADWSRIDTTPPPPDRGTLTGTVTFVGTPPAAGEVVVGIHGAYPPSGPPYGMTDPMPMGADGETQSYRIEEIRFGTYACLAVYWVDPDDYGAMSRYHDISTTSPDGPEPVSLAEEEPEVTRDLTADWGRL